MIAPVERFIYRMNLRVRVNDLRNPVAALRFGDRLPIAHLHGSEHRCTHAAAFILLHQHQLCAGDVSNHLIPERVFRAAAEEMYSLGIYAERTQQFEIFAKHETDAL